MKENGDVGGGSGNSVMWRKLAGRNLVGEGLFSQCPGNPSCMLSSVLDARIRPEPSGHDTRHQVTTILGWWGDGHKIKQIIKQSARS